MTEPRVAIIGAGVAGISTAYVLQQNGFTDWVMLEKGSDVGGVWHWNRYPGLTCDVPSQIYQFAFAPKPDWDRVWATGSEIQQYLRDVVEQLGFHDRIRCDTEVAEARYDEDSLTWTLTLGGGKVMQVDFVICATGVLSNPSIPNISGLSKFHGPVVHTARWDSSVATSDMRIAVIGTGSTGVQVVSALQCTARSIGHFVRSPQWVLWAPMGARQPALMSSLLSRLPRALSVVHQVLLWGSGIFVDVVTQPSWRRRAVQRYARMSLRMQVRDPQLRAQLMPDYEPLCKRQVVSGSYYRAIQKPHVDLITSDIVEVTSTGIRTADDVEHRADVIVLATGFRAHDYMRPMKIVGRKGITLDQAWQSGPRAYSMTAIPGFPNLFTVLGPNSPTGSISLQYSAELTARYIAQWLHRFRRNELRALEVREDATAEFNRDVSRGLGPTVWNTGCNSWYRTDGGSIDLWPFNRREMKRRLGTPNDAHFIITR